MHLRTLVRSLIVGGLSLVAACKQTSTSPSPTPNPNGAGGDATFSAGVPKSTLPAVIPAATQAIAPVTTASTLPTSSMTAACSSAASCPPAQQDVISMTTNGQLVGLVGAPVNWVFYGRDLNSLTTTQIVSGVPGSSRRVMILLSNLPPGATVNPPLNGSALYNPEAIVWTPTQAETGTLMIVLRDYDRCMTVDPTPTQTCNALTAGTYDISKLVPWQIVQQPPATTAVTASPAAPATPASVPQAPTAGSFIGNVLGGMVSSLITGPIGSSSYTYGNQGQVYPDCHNNGGSGYGCNWACGTLWCSKDDPSLANASICTVTKGGGSTCPH